MKLAAIANQKKDEIFNNEQPDAKIIERQGLIKQSNQLLPKSILIQALDEATKDEI